MKVARDVGGWSIVPEWVLDTDISDRAVRLYALLGRYADAGGSSFASRRKLSERLRCSVNSVDRAIAELKACGALTSEDRFRENGGQSANLVTLRTSPPVGTPLPMGGDPPLPTGAAPKNESQKERETTCAAAPQNGARAKPTKAQADEVWDTLTDIFGPALTRSAEQLRGKLVQSLAQAGATREEIMRRAKTWPQHFDSATLTAAALEKHWDTLGRKPLRRR